jgi:hypothetical protein
MISNLKDSYIKVDGTLGSNIDQFFNNSRTYPHFGNNISCPYVYDIEFFNKIKQPKESNKTFIQKRTQLNDLKENIMSETFGNVCYMDYWKNLSTCEYAVDLCKNKSAGQVIAECSLLDVICFASPHKLMSQLLLPEFCHVNDEAETIKKWA